MEVTTELKLPEDPNLLTYLEDYVVFYNHIWRRVWEDFTNGVFKYEYNSNLNDYTKMIRSHYNILSRVANSIIRDVKGRYKTLLALKKSQLADLENKIVSKEKEIERLDSRVKILKEKAGKNELDETELKKLRKLKRNLYLKRNALDEKRKRRDKLDHQIKTGRIPLTFGSKKLFSAQFHLDQTEFKNFSDWKQAHNFALNHSILFLGRIDEAHSNQVNQLLPQEDGSFCLKLRKDRPFRIKDQKDVIEVKGLKIKYLGDSVRRIVLAQTKEEGKKPLTCRFLKRTGRGWYLQLMFETDREEPVQSERDGVLSIDFNDSMLAITELNDSGNLVDDYIVKLEKHNLSGRNLAEIRDVTSQIAFKAYQLGKPVVKEKLDFRKTKAKVGKDRKYNKMVHSLAYSRFDECLKRACERKKVKLIEVNPAYTSRIGIGKYKNRKKLNNHTCAALVIGRRAQGYIDRLNETA